MKHLVCPNCGNEETEENLFPGIFTLGTACSTVQFCSDLDYIQYRKMQYKKARK